VDSCLNKQPTEYQVHSKCFKYLENESSDSIFTWVTDKQEEKYKIFKNSFLFDEIQSNTKGPCKDVRVYITDDSIIFKSNIKPKGESDLSEYTLTNNKIAGTLGCIPEFEKASSIQSGKIETDTNYFKPLSIYIGEQIVYPAFSAIHPNSKTTDFRCVYFIPENECEFLKLFKMNVKSSKIYAGFDDEPTNGIIKK